MPVKRLSSPRQGLNTQANHTVASARRMVSPSTKRAHDGSSYDDDNFATYDDESYFDDDAFVTNEEDYAHSEASDTDPDFDSTTSAP